VGWGGALTELRNSGGSFRIRNNKCMSLRVTPCRTMLQLQAARRALFWQASPTTSTGYAAQDSVNYKLCACRLGAYLILGDCPCWTLVWYLAFPSLNVSLANFSLTDDALAGTQQ
jgi:hypothetical protein